MDWVILGALAGSSSACVAIITFWIRFSDRIAKAEVLAEQARLDSKDSSDKLAILSASFSLYREQIAREYIHREVMREVEERLTQAIERLGDRLDRVLERAEK